MKTLIGIVFMATMLISPNAHAMFGHTAEERQRRIDVEQQLSQEQQRLDAQQRLTVEQQHLTIQQQQRASRWQTIAFVLGVGAVVALIAGTAIGSNGRYHANREE